jgi:hypothetical protein
MTSLNLQSAAETEHWIHRQLQQKTDINILVEQLLETKTPASLLRAARLCTRLGDYVRMRQLATEALSQSTSAEVALYAKIVICGATLFEGRSASGVTARNHPNLLIPVLVKAVNELAIAPSGSELKLEGQCAGHLALTIAYQQIRNYTPALEHASEALVFAEALGLEYTRDTALQHVLGCRAFLGQLSESIDIIQTNTNPDTPTTQVAEYQRQLSFLLLGLGNAGAGMQALLDIRDAYPIPQVIDAHIQMMEAMCGKAKNSQPVTRDELWGFDVSEISNSFRQMVEIRALPRHNSFAAERYQALNDILENTKKVFQGTEYTPWSYRWLHWIHGWALLQQGKYGQLERFLANIQVPEDQWLAWRLLMASLKLETALQLEYSGKTASIEDEIKITQIFAEARTTNYANAQGLAELLSTWHPAIAAYLSVVPKPVFECIAATQSILNVHQQNTVWDKIMPPPYAAELILRSFNLDLRSDRFDDQVRLNGLASKQRDRLLQYSWGKEYLATWLPVNTSVQLAYYLIKVGGEEPAYAQAAQSLLVEYGTTPKSKAFEPVIVRTEKIAAALKNFLEASPTPFLPALKQLDKQIRES